MPRRSTASKIIRRDAICPFCPLLCDDLIITGSDAGLKVDAGGCARAAAGYRRRIPANRTARVGDRSVPLAEAQRAAAKLLASADRPLIGGLAADTAAVRAAVQLAERAGAVLDHKHSADLAAAARTVQERTWFGTSLSEVRSRADNVLLINVDPGAVPRLAERFLVGKPSVGSIGTLRPASLAGVADLHAVRRGPDDTIAAVNALTAQLDGTAKLSRSAIRGLAPLAEAFSDAAYTAVLWSGSGMTPDQLELLADAIGNLMITVNRTGRAAALDLGGAEGGSTAKAVCTWLTGYPLRVGFRDGLARYEPVHNGAGMLLDTGAVDALLWLSTFETSDMPEAGCPAAHLGIPGSDQGKADVFIPVGTAGLDHDGQLTRCDSTVTLVARGVRDLGLPAAGEVLTGITRELAEIQS